MIGGRSLLGVTLERARTIASEGCVWIVCGDEHAAAMRKEAALPAKRVLVEPMRRNTAMLRHLPSARRKTIRFVG